MSQQGSLVTPLRNTVVLCDTVTTFLAHFSYNLDGTVAGVTYTTAAGAPYVPVGAIAACVGAGGGGGSDPCICDDVIPHYERFGNSGQEGGSTFVSPLSMFSMTLFILANAATPNNVQIVTTEGTRTVELPANSTLTFGVEACSQQIPQGGGDPSSGVRVIANGSARFDVAWTTCPDLG